jgi:hypothetical protein
MYLSFVQWSVVIAATAVVGASTIIRVRTAILAASIRTIRVIRGRYIV